MHERKRMREKEYERERESERERERGRKKEREREREKGDSLILGVRLNFCCCSDNRRINNEAPASVIRPRGVGGIAKGRGRQSEMEFRCFDSMARLTDS
jgi:hypothetical protein